jgi:predicted O-methyltransferase YrrM
VDDKLDLELARQVDHYIENLFVPRDAALDQGLADARAAGLPTINVSPNEGKLLYLIARLVRAARILEVGTLGGYSTAWLARALPASGHLVSLELDPNHADVARKNLDRCGLAGRVEIRVGRASDSLRAMIAQHEAPFDLTFIDADKEGYREYLDLCLQLSHPGSVILADNLIRSGRVLEANPAEANARGVKVFNEAIAVHPRLESLILPIIREKLDGISISIVL